MSGEHGTALRPGERVTIGPNDAKVVIGSAGRFVRVVEETGCLLVDIDSRGRVAFRPESVTRLDAPPVATEQPAEQAPRRMGRPPGTRMSDEARARMSEAQRKRHGIGVGREHERAPAVAGEGSGRVNHGISRELYLDAGDTAEELNCSREMLRKTAKLLKVGRCANTICRYTARDISKLRTFLTLVQDSQIPMAITARLFEADGTPKVAMTESQARQHAAWLSKRRGTPMDAYECPVCDWWHVGNRRRGDTVEQGAA